MASFWDKIAKLPLLGFAMVYQQIGVTLMGVPRSLLMTLEDHIAAIGDEFLAQILLDGAHIHDLCTALRVSQEPEIELTALHGIAHTHAGSAGSFGFSEVGSLARLADQSIM
jgi:hypothetical protein